MKFYRSQLINNQQANEPLKQGLQYYASMS